jgi:hypothetical protein
MRKLGSAIVFSVILTFGLSLAVPAEDVPETSFDESESLPYESTPLFSIVVVQVATRAAEHGLAWVSPVRFAFLNGYSECYPPYGPGPVHPHPDSSTIFDCSFRC